MEHLPTQPSFPSDQPAPHSNPNSHPTRPRLPDLSDDELFAIAVSCNLDINTISCTADLRPSQVVEWLIQPHIFARCEQLAIDARRKVDEALARAMPKAIEVLKRTLPATQSPLGLDRASIRARALDELLNHSQGAPTSAALRRSLDSWSDEKFDDLPSDWNDRLWNDDEIDEDLLEEVQEAWEDNQDERALEHWLRAYEAEFLATRAFFDNLPVAQNMFFVRPASRYLPVAQNKIVAAPANPSAQFLTIAAGRALSIADLPVAQNTFFANPSSHDLPVAPNKFSPDSPPAPWFSQPQLAALLGTTRQNIGLHARNILRAGLLKLEDHVKPMPTLRTEGNRIVERVIDHYSRELAQAIAERIRTCSPSARAA